MLSFIFQNTLKELSIFIALMKETGIKNHLSLQYYRKNLNINCKMRNFEIKYNSHYSGLGIKSIEIKTLSIFARS